MNTALNPIQDLSEKLAGLGVDYGRHIAKALGINADDLAHIEDLKLLAAGERQQLGDLLKTAQLLTHAKLVTILNEQRKTGQKMGEILVSLGHLSVAETEVVLAFQENQCRSSAPLEGKLFLGKVLVAIGDISPTKLARGLQWQSVYGGRIGDALVAVGHVTENQVRHALELQRKLVAAVLLTALEMVSNLLASLQVSPAK